MPVRTDRIFLLIAEVELAEAYKTKSVGTAANDFVQYIRIFAWLHLSQSGLGSPQISGTGKSRMHGGRLT